MKSWEIKQGDWIEVLRTMPDNSVHCVVTSPPYWGLRDYGTATWSGGDPHCDHKRSNVRPDHTGRTITGRGLQASAVSSATPYKDKCGICGAVRIDAQLGLEPSPHEYIEKMVDGFREVRRVLRTDGTAWINMGDCYATGAVAVGECPGGGERGEKWKGYRGTRQSGKHEYISKAMGPMIQPNRMPIPGLKPKDLVGLPWRLALALQADGWYLRSDIIWNKPNPMPESVGDRPTKAHEYIFLLAKSEAYFYDAEAVKEPASTNTHSRGGGVNPKAKKEGQHLRMRVDRDPRHIKNNGVGWGYADGQPKPRTKQNESFSEAVTQVVTHRNKRSVWTMATSPFPEAHFATFPPALPTQCILAGTSEAGCCSVCGRPIQRVTETYETGATQKRADGWDSGDGEHGTIHRNGREKGQSGQPVLGTRTVGWESECCRLFGSSVSPCTVLDPFSGAATTGVAALRLGRRYIGIELNPEYIAIAERRLNKATEASL